jgi:hypothetical protein
MIPGVSDAGRAMKLAERVEMTLAKNTTLKEPKQLDPRSVLVSPMNRDGAPPNVQHVHAIVKGVQVNGFDRSRPPVGICVEYRSSEGEKKLLDHNKRFSQGCVLFPPIDEEKALYGSLACSHLNIAIRCIASGTQSSVGNLSDMTAQDQALKEVVTHGHKWWILPETVDSADLVDISLWRNQDQNENQATHEIELLQCIMATAATMSETKAKVNMGDLVSKTQRRNPAKIPLALIQVLAKYFSQFLAVGKLFLVQEVVDFHTALKSTRRSSWSLRRSSRPSQAKRPRGLPLLAALLVPPALHAGEDPCRSRRCLDGCVPRPYLPPGPLQEARRLQRCRDDDPCDQGGLHPVPREDARTQAGTAGGLRLHQLDPPEHLWQAFP